MVSIQINVSEAFWNSYNHQHILSLPVTQIQRGITCVTLNMQIVSVAYRFTYAIIFLADPGAGYFLLMFTFSLPFSEFRNFKVSYEFQVKGATWQTLISNFNGMVKKEGKNDTETKETENKRVDTEESVRNTP